MYLIVVASKVGDESNMFRSDDLNPRLEGNGHFLLGRLACACPLGGVVVGQVTNPVCKTDLNVSIKRGYWKVLHHCMCVQQEVSGTVIIAQLNVST